MPGLGWGDKEVLPRQSWVRMERLSDIEIDTGMALVFGKLLHFKGMQDPADLTQVEKVDYHWSLEMRNIWQGTQLRNAWVRDRSTLLAAWGMAIALTQPFFAQDPSAPAKARPCVKH
eukprot:6168205-Heterocapsa_arctica.AAC.1